MNIIKRSDGRYCGTVQVNGSRKYFYGDSPANVKKQADQWNGSIGKSGVCFKIDFENWMNEYVKAKSQSTYSQYDTLSKNHILPILGAIKVSKILPFNCQTVLNTAKKENGDKLSTTTLRHIRKIMHAFFEHEKKLKKTIKENPCDNVTVPKGAKTRPRRAATPQELEFLWKRMEKTHYFYCFQFLLITGLRPSEACGIKFSDIKLKKIVISEARTRWDVSDGKTRSATRTLDISPAMAKIIKDQKEYLKEERIYKDYLFPTLRGEPSNAGYLSRAWSRLKEDSNISLTLYELRHTFVSLMIDKLPIKDLQTLIGHSTSMDTTGTYGHVFERNKNTAQIIDDSISQYLPKTKSI